MDTVKIIGLDESGKFEIIGSEDIRFIGGYVLLSDKSRIKELESKIVTMLRQICELFEEQCHKKEIDDKQLRALCEELKIQPVKMKHDDNHVVFPLSLHGSAKKDTSKVFFRDKAGGGYGDVSLKDSNKRFYIPWEKLFTEYLCRRVLFFLKENKAKLFCYLYPKASLPKDEENKNLYETMITDVMRYEIETGLFQSVRRYLWEMPTRYIEVMEGEQANIYPDNYNPRIIPEEKGKEKEKEKTRYYMTSKDTYRGTLLGLIDQNQGEKGCLGILVNDISNESDFKGSETLHAIDIKSIAYKNVDNKQLTPFHYISDVVCSKIRRLLEQNKWLDCMKRGTGIFEALRKTVGFEPDYDFEIRVYGEPDERLQQMFHAVLKGKLHQYYNLCYEIRNSDKEYDKFLYQYWKPRMDEMIQERIKDSAYVLRHIDDAIDLIDGDMTYREEYVKGTYIVECFFEDIFGWKLKKPEERFEINALKVELPDDKLYLFILNLLRAYNHRGAVLEPQKIIDWVNGSGILQKLYPQGELQYQNICLQYYFNSLQYEEVFNIVLNLERKATDRITDFLKNFSDENPLVKDNRTAQARLLSSAGQACGFLLTDPEAWNEVERELLKRKGIECYEKALSIFEELQQTGNYAITMSHYLQYLCLLEDNLRYIANASKYFESSDMEKQLEYVLSRNNLFYARVFLKGLETFYMQKEFTSKYLERLLKYAEQVQIKRHPLEIIEAAILRMTLRIKGEDIDMEGELYKRVVTPVPGEEDVILLIRFHTKLCAVLQQHQDWSDHLVADHIDMLDHTDSCEKITVNDVYLLNRFGKVLEKKAEEMTYKELEQFLNKKLGYEYC